jgi:capsular exopolysaccharide synthesis family protein
MQRILEALARSKQDGGPSQLRAAPAREPQEVAPALAEVQPDELAQALPGEASVTERIAVAAAFASGHLTVADTVVPFTRPAAKVEAVEPINPQAIRGLEAIAQKARDDSPDASADDEVDLPPPSVPRGAEDIVYSRTRRHAVSQEFFRAHRVIAGFPHTPAAEAYRILATHVVQLVRENGWNVLAVVSPSFGEGKTLTAVNLAITLASEIGHTVLLVDGDLRNPKVHTFFDLPAHPGLSDHMVQGVPLEDLLVNPGIDKLVVLPGGRALRSASELLGSRQMQALVTELKQRYAARVVVFDLPPVLMSADTLAFVPHVDATLMVVEEGKTGAEEAARAAEVLRSAKLIGTVLNKSSFSSVEGSPLFKGRAVAGSRREPSLNGVPHDDGERVPDHAAAKAARPAFWRRIFFRAPR